MEERVSLAKTGMSDDELLLLVKYQDRVARHKRPTGSIAKIVDKPKARLICHSKNCQGEFGTLVLAGNLSPAGRGGGLLSPVIPQKGYAGVIARLAMESKPDFHVMAVYMLFSGAFKKNADEVYEFITREPGGHDVVRIEEMPVRRVLGVVRCHLCRRDSIILLDQEIIEYALHQARTTVKQGVFR